MTLELRPYQHEIVDFVIDNPRCNLFVPMGAGKTVSTLTAINHLSLVEDVFPALVIAPLRVATSTWPDEVRKFPHLRHLKVSVVAGDAAKREAALRVPADIFCINYENLPWLAQTLGGDWPFKMVVADECSKLKGFRLRQGTKRAKALAKYIHAKVKRYVGLTGTPAANGLQDLWAIAWMVDQGERLGRSYQGFMDRWFQAIRMGADPHAVQHKPLPFAQQEIQDRIRDVCLTIDIKKYFNTEEPIVNTIYVELPPKVRRLYKDMEREMFMRLGESDIEALNAASKTMKCLQIASGNVWVDKGAGVWKEVHDIKLDALASILEEANGMPVLVAYQWVPSLERILKAFPQARFLDTNPQTEKDWNAGRIPMLVAHPQSAGHGLNLQDGGNILVCYDHWWNLEEFQQIIERIGPTRQAQSGHDRPVFIHHIVARGTVDELVMARRETKREVQDLLLEAMRGRKL